MSREIHIAYVCADRGVPVGGRKGASAHVFELARALGQQRAIVHIIAARTSEGNDLKQLGSVTDVGSDRPMRQLRQLLLKDARTARQQARVSETFGLMLNQAVTRELERLHRSWRIDAVYERYSLWSHAGASFARTARVPFLLEVNAPLREEQQRYRTLDNAAAAGDIESYLLQSSDFVLVPSAELKPYLERRGLSARRAQVIPNAADPALFLGNPTPPAADQDFVIGFLGTLKPWHGLDDLLRAFRELARHSPHYRLLIAGDGPERKGLEKTLRAWNLHRRATFTGEVDHGDVPALLARMHVAVAPYPRLSGFYFSPLKVFEYMAAGVPVVASSIGQLATLLTHQRNALLYKPGAVRELAHQIEAVRLDPSAAAQRARRARRMIEQRYTWQHNARRVLELIERAGAKIEKERARGSR